jgi:hypothetical protein
MSTRLQLESNEQLLWMGRPRGGFMFSKSDRERLRAELTYGAIPVAIIFALFHHQSGIAILAAALSPAIFVIGSELLGMFTGLLARQRTSYSLTDRRVLVEGDFPYLSLKSTPLLDMAQTKLELDADGSGTIFIQRKSAVLPWRAFKPIFVPLFEAIEDAQKVYVMLLAAQQLAISSLEVGASAGPALQSLTP